MAEGFKKHQMEMWGKENESLWLIVGNAMSHNDPWWGDAMSNYDS